MVKIVNIEKNGAVITITGDNSNQYAFNVATKKCTNIKTGRELKRNPFGYTEVCDRHTYITADDMLKAKFEIIKYISRGVCISNYWYDFHYTTFWDILSKYEILFTLTDLIPISNMYDFHLPKEMPKGYIKWLRDNNKKLTNISLQEFEFFNTSKNLSQEEKTFIEWFEGSIGSGYYRVFYNKLMRDRDFLSIVSKMFNVSFKNKDLKGLLNFTNLNPSDIRFYDGNRDISYNLENAKNLRNAELNVNIAKTQSKFTDLEKLDIGYRYCVVVPKNVEDLIMEGKEQNNCVGHYYNDAIAEGRFGIFFVRLKANREKSYMTCRFDCSSGKILEYKLKNNEWVHNDHEVVKECFPTIKREIINLLSL